MSRSQEFRRLCVELAVEHGFRIANLELQQSIVNERSRLRGEREHGPIHRPVTFRKIEIEHKIGKTLAADDLSL